MKEHTIILVPHARAKFRKWRFTTLQAGFVLGSLAILTLGGVTATFLYFDSSFDRRQLEEIEQENADLRRVNQDFEHTIREIEGQLSEFDDKVEKLAIVAGISELTSDAGIGGPAAIEAGDPFVLDPSAVEGAMTDSEYGSLGEDRGEGQGRLGLLESWADQLGQNLSVLQGEFSERNLMISQKPAISPVRGLLTSGFGYRSDPFTKKRTFHGGIDIVAPRGKDVKASGNGIVVKAGRAQGLGNSVYVSHGYGLTTRYGHLLKMTVKVGDRVKRGDVVGLVGNTGRATGYHLHYEVRVDGRPVNPLGYILDSTREE